MLAKLDAWLAKNIFWPIIIKVCQETCCSKWHFGRACSFLWICIMIAGTEQANGFELALVGFLAISEVLSLGLRKDLPYWSAGWARFMFWALFPLELLKVIGGAQWIRMFSVPAMLFSLYAATLPHVPPKDRKERRGTRKARAV